MTNLLATIAVQLSLATNWTGVYFGTNELGYVLTNHEAVVVYQRETNKFLLKSVPSNIAVWRPQMTVLITNSVIPYWWYGKPITGTNNIILN